MHACTSIRWSVSIPAGVGSRIHDRVHRSRSKPALPSHATRRWHLLPSVVAEAFASLNILYPGRIFLGVGSGEALNEEAATGTGPKWPARSERLGEATEIMRKLW